MSKRIDWKSEAKYWYSLAHMQMLALSAVAKDRAYECRCGDPPYTDGDPCPGCFCSFALQQFQEAKEKRKAQFAG